MTPGSPHYPGDEQWEGYRTRFSGYTLDTLNGWVDDGTAAYDPEVRGWTVTREDGSTFLVADPDAREAGGALFTAGLPGASDPDE
jgi:hypothetical protein